MQLSCPRLAKIVTKPMYRKLVLGTGNEKQESFVVILTPEKSRICVSQLTLISFEVGQSVKSILNSAPQADFTDRSVSPALLPHRIRSSMIFANFLPSRILSLFEFTSAGTVEL